MNNNPSNRLPEYDYSQPGGYFITLITLKRQSLFGELIGGTMKLSTIGEIFVLNGYERVNYGRTLRSTSM